MSQLQHRLFAAVGQVRFHKYRMAGKNPFVNKKTNRQSPAPAEGNLFVGGAPVNNFIGWQ
jgi:hypothetical protein